MDSAAEVVVDRRRGPRVPVTVEIRYGTVDALFSEFTENVNEGGVFVKTDSPLALDEVVVLQFTLPGANESIQARGRVVRVDPTGMAIEFERLDGSARDMIDGLVRQLRAAPEASDQDRRQLDRDA